MTDDPFRNDHDAALARADALERENQHLREELRDAQAPKSKPEPAQKPKRRRHPRARRWDLPWIRRLAGVAAILGAGVAVVETSECRAHRRLYTEPGKPLAGFIAGDEVVVVDSVESKFGWRDMGSEDFGIRVTVLDAATGKQLAVHVFPWGTSCQPLGVSIWCGKSGSQGARYDVPAFDPIEWPAPPQPEDDESCKTDAMLEAHCQHAEHVGKLLVVLSHMPDKRAYAIDPASYHTVWTFGRAK